MNTGATNAIVNSSILKSIVQILTRSAPRAAPPRSNVLFLQAPYDLPASPQERADSNHPNVVRQAADGLSWCASREEAEAFIDHG